MLEDKRIKEAEQNIRSYLKEGLLKKTNSSEEIMNVFLQNAKESLKVANGLYEREESDLWVIVCSYYSMYYYANAVLLSIGYKVGDKIVHKVTADALLSLVRNKLKKSLLEEYEFAREEALNLAGAKADTIIESFDLERNKRNYVQYETTSFEKRKKATTSILRAKVFAKEIEKLLL